jgi:hypothetical protein
MKIEIENCTGVAVGDIDGAFERGTKKNSNDAFASVFGDSIVVINYAE